MTRTGPVAPVLTGPTVVGVLALLAGANVARSTVVPTGAHLAYNLGVAALVVVIGVFGGALGRVELGLGRDRVGAGLRWGLAAVALVTATVAVATVLPAGRSFFDVEDAHVDGTALARRVLLLVPLGTVLGEELAFRGVLHGLLARLYPARIAVAVGAAVFGLWHVFPAWLSVDATEGTGARLGLAAGTFVATTGAGLTFGWLRVRSGSLFAPTLAHLATNTIPLTAAWLMLRAGALPG